MATKDKKTDPVPTAPKGKPADVPAAPPPRKSRRGLWIGLVVACALAAAGLGTWFALRTDEPEAGAKGAKPKTEKKAEKAKPAIFVALDTFTVNLQQEAGEHILQTSFSVKIAEPAIEQAIKHQMPEIRSRLLLLLSSKRPSELTSIEGKQALANQIAEEINKALNPGAAAPAPGAAPAGPVQSVFFTNFIIQ